MRDVLDQLDHLDDVQAEPAFIIWAQTDDDDVVSDELEDEDEDDEDDDEDDLDEDDDEDEDEEKDED